MSATETTILATVAQIESRIAGAAPHLNDCTIMASRKEGTNANWSAVAALARAAPSDLEWAVETIRGLISELRDARKPVPATVPVRRPYPAAAAVEAVARRAYHGILHDPEGRYSVGRTVVSSMPWPWAFALFAHGPRADHSRERVWTWDDGHDREEQAARAFVDAIGVDAAMAACRAYDEKYW